MLPKRKIVLLALVFCFVLSVIFAEHLIAGSVDHDCTGENCPVCLQIEAARTLKLAGITLHFAGGLVFFASVFKINTGLNDYHLSLVDLKVRFNS